MSTLKDGEPHPAAYSARDYIRSLGIETLSRWRETFASCSLAGNRGAEICSETLRRVITGEPVSDRYLLGLAWTIKQGEEKSDGV